MIGDKLSKSQPVLTDKIALVTGAGHPLGMGAATCRVLAAQGAEVVATDLDLGGNAAGLEELVASINENGGKASHCFLNVTDDHSIAEAFRDLDARHHGLDIVFNNAGLGRGVGPFLEIEDQEWDDIWAVNVMGMVRCCRAAIPFMIKRGGGSIINNASLAGLGVVPHMSGYSATKFAVVGLTKSLAAEFGPQNIRCNAVCPGSIQTQMYEQEIEMLCQSEGKSRDEVIEEIDELVALKRSATASEVADVVAYLAGPASSYITGVALPVAGGMAPGL